MTNKSIWRSLLVVLLMLLIFEAVRSSFKGPPSGSVPVISYSRFKNELAANNIKKIRIKGANISGEFLAKTKVAEVVQGKEVVKEVDSFSTIMPPLVDQGLMAELTSHKVEIQALSTETSPFANVLIFMLPWLLIIGIWWLAIRAMRKRGEPGGMMGNFVQSGAHKYTAEEKVKTTFDDVAGMENSKQELKEIVDYLRNPKHFQRMGGKVPKGVLLIGPPGTGKTLLARAVAGEAGVTFFNISASQFIEMFVGIGASRVRDLFTNAKKASPSIIFIDELDAVGRSRGAGFGGGHDEREQTLNQLLSEMDGFDRHEEIIVMAATNRPDVLDPALLRPGRFDRHVVIERPDWRDREKILQVHAAKVIMDPAVDLKVIARGTPGMTGADLENLINESAILASRGEATMVGMEHLEKAKDKILMGGERKMYISDAERRITAYHEAGHTVVAKLLPDSDPIHKVTIIPRGMALGVTQQLPEDDRYHYPQSYLEHRLAVAMGGRVAERLVMGEISTGGQNDLKTATDLAEKMVCQWGMSEKVGAVAFSRGEEHPFLGRKLAEEKTFSEAMAWRIDQEISALISKAESLAESLLVSNRDKLDRMAEALQEEETLDHARVDQILLGTGRG